MALYNILRCTLKCPRCGQEGVTDVDFRFGHLNLEDYSLGDQIRWEDGKKPPRGRPSGGNYLGEGYSECSGCSLDFWVMITVSDDVIKSVQPDPSRKGYK